MVTWITRLLPGKYIVLLIAITLALIAGWVALAKFKKDQQMIGWNKAIEAVSKQNAIAAKAALKVQLTVEQCFDDGGDWDISTGECIKEVEANDEETNSTVTPDGR